jgi:hypothetical protein
MRESIESQKYFSSIRIATVNVDSKIVIEEAKNLHAMDGNG